MDYERAKACSTNRRTFIALGGAGGGFFFEKSTEHLKPILISVNALLDRGDHAVKGLSEAEITAFKNYQEKGRREYATRGIHFDVRIVEGAYLRTQGYSEIHPKFLAPKMINLFVTDTLGYDMDRDRTGGCSVGPHPPIPRIGGDRFYKTFLGLREAAATTHAHEYAHHCTLDTQKDPPTTAHLWADRRNDYCLWR